MNMKVGAILIRSAKTLVPALAIWSALYFSACEKAAEVPKILFSPLTEALPRVVSSNPDEETGVYDEGGIFLEFNVDMDREKTQNSFSINGTASASGKPVWDERTMYYTLDQPLKVGESYVLTLSAAASSASGRIMEKDFIVHFITGSDIVGPRILSTTPLDNAQQVSPDAEIIILFSRTMDPDSVRNAFSISPSVSGDFVWDATGRSLSFRPYSPLALAGLYSVSIGTGALDANGASLPQVHRFAFRVGEDFTPPTVAGVYEEGATLPLAPGATGIFKDSSYTARFSEPMDYLATESAFSLTRLANGSRVSGVFYWNAVFTEFEFVPERPLEPEGDYRLRIQTGAKDAVGNPMETEYQTDFLVNNDGGAVNSEFTKITLARKTISGAIQDLSLDPSVFSAINLPLAGFGGDTMTIRLEFSHELDAATAPDNISLRYLTGPNPSVTWQLIAVRFESVSPLNNNVLLVDYTGVTENKYELSIRGGRGGILSKSLLGETGSWMSGDMKFYLNIQP